MSTSAPPAAPQYTNSTTARSIAVGRRGFVRWFDATKGFGFISTAVVERLPELAKCHRRGCECQECSDLRDTIADGTKDVFVHYSSIKRGAKGYAPIKTKSGATVSASKWLEADAVVDFDVEQRDDGKLYAVNVFVVEQ